MSELLVQVDDNCSTSSCCSEKYDEAVMYIRNAISALSACAKTDDIAKDCIVNLSVVLFDLKGDA